MSKETEAGNKNRVPLVGSSTLLEHLASEWMPIKGDDGNWCVVTVSDDEPWFIAEMCGTIPGDEYGLHAARRICEAHNILLRSNSKFTNKGVADEKHK